MTPPIFAADEDHSDPGALSHLLRIGAETGWFDRRVEGWACAVLRVDETCG
jgi:hypothetical protein